MNTRRTRIRHRARRRGPSRLVIIVFSSMLTLGFLSVAAVVGWVVYIATTGPEIRELQPRENGRSSQIFAADGTRIGFFQSRVVRQPVASTEIPDVMREATVAVEDRRFYEHKGVDFEGVIRAAVRNLTSGSTVEGGSTLTMQLVKVLYADNKRDIRRKIREAKLAEELENIHPGQQGKKWILNQYLNNVPYGTAGGQEVLGVQAAARAYYNKAARDLTLAQAAMLAGLPQAPTSYNPLLHPKAAMTRRNDVLSRMADQGMITTAQAAEAKAEGLGVKPSEYYSTRTEGYVFDYVKAQLVAEYGRAAVSRGGLKVYTTIDLKKQRLARKAIADTLTSKIASPPSAAVVTIDPANGHIVAMASSENYATRKFNIAANIKRRPGSTFKVMGLMAAVRRGVVPESTYYVSKPLRITTGPFADAANPIVVKTYGGTYSGSMNLVKGTLTSDNTVYMQLGLDIGPDLTKKAAVDMGIKSPLQGLPAEILGGIKFGVTPLEMANAYATIADGGYKNKPTAISKVVFPKSNEFPNGKTYDLGHPKRAKTFQNGVTGEVTKILQQNVTGGTGTRAQIQCPAAGKTGTVDDFEDAWFVGFTPKLATSVWVGYEPQPVQMNSQFYGASVAGGTFPAAIWGAYMKEAVKGAPCGEFRKITEPVTASKFTGRFAKGGGSGDDDVTGTTPDTVGTTPAEKEKTTRIDKPTSGGTGGTGNSGNTNTGNTGGGNAGGVATPPAAHDRDPTALGPDG